MCWRSALNVEKRGRCGNGGVAPPFPGVFYFVCEECCLLLSRLATTSIMTVRGPTGPEPDPRWKSVLWGDGGGWLLASGLGLEGGGKDGATGAGDRNDCATVCTGGGAA